MVLSRGGLIRLRQRRLRTQRLEPAKALTRNQRTERGGHIVTRNWGRARRCPRKRMRIVMTKPSYWPQNAASSQPIATHTELTGETYHGIILLEKIRTPLPALPSPPRGSGKPDLFLSIPASPTPPGTPGVTRDRDPWWGPQGSPWAVPWDLGSQRHRWGHQG